MKFLPELYPHDVDAVPTNAFTLTDGLLGFPDHTRAELLYNAEQLPFLWMKLSGPAGSVNFVVLEPGIILPGYEIELFDADAENLGLTDPADAMVLNIVTLNPRFPQAATVNLIGPVVVNRRTLFGRQVVIENHAQYSARHPVVEEAVAARATA
jgi:flagellar assembly factor FliW